MDAIAQAMWDYMTFRKAYEVGDFVILCLPSNAPHKPYVEFEGVIEDIVEVRCVVGGASTRYEIGQVSMRVVQEIRENYNEEGVLWVTADEIIGRDEQ